MTEYGRIHTDGSRSGGQPLIKTEAMDNLIAQDADLIDLRPVLLPCPFCGGLQIEAFHHIDRGWGASWHVECVAEECGNSTCHHDTEAAAIAAWNNRQPTQSDCEVAASIRSALYRACSNMPNYPKGIVEPFVAAHHRHGYDQGYYDGCTRQLTHHNAVAAAAPADRIGGAGVVTHGVVGVAKDTAAEWQAGYEAGVEAAAKALEADAKRCDCSARNEDECACGAWCEWKYMTSARAVEIVRALQEQRNDD
jgi:hypothetical protein